MFEFFTGYWPYLIEAFALVAGICGAVHAIMTKRDVRSAIGWAALLIMAPIVGVLLYIVFGINRIRIRRRLRRRKVATVRLSPNRGLTVADAVEEIQVPQRFLPMMRLGDSVTDYPLTAGNCVEPLESGDVCYNSMLAEIDRAKTWILLETYIFDNDHIGRRFVERLAAATKRGVEVRVLVDAIGARYSRPSILTNLSAAGIPHALYIGGIIGPRLPYANLRTHRKLLIIDNRICFIGGMNIREAFSAEVTGPLANHDTHFRVQGPVVEDLSHIFADDWLFASGERLPKSATARNSQTCSGNILARAVPSGPDRQLECTHDMIMGVLSVASERVTIMTPYFLPDRALIGALAVAARRGVRIDILLPLKSNLPIVGFAVTAHLEEVIEIGCRVWQSPGIFDHSKLMAVDRQWAYIGSSNLDPRSFRLNFEIDLELYDITIATWIEKRIDSHIAKARRVRIADLVSRPFWHRLRDKTAWLASPYL